MEEENKTLEETTEIVLQQAEQDKKEEEQAVEAENKNNVPLILILVVLIAAIGAGIGFYIISGHDKQPVDEEQKEEKKEEKTTSLKEDEVKSLIKKYENIIPVNSVSNTVNPLTTFISVNGELLDIKNNTIESTILNTVLRNYYNKEDVIKLDELKENINKMYAVGDSLQLPNSFCYYYSGNEYIAYKLNSNEYIKEESNGCHGAYSAFQDTIKEKYIENTLNGNELKVVYRILFTQFDSSSNGSIKIYSDGKRTKEVTTLKNTSDDPNMYQFEELKDEYYNQGLKLVLTFVKENDTYILTKVE